MLKSELSYDWVYEKGAWCVAINRVEAAKQKITCPKCVNKLETRITGDERFQQDVNAILDKWNASNLAQLNTNIQTIINERNQFEQELNNAKKEVNDKQIQINILDTDKSKLATLTNENKMLEQRIKELEGQEKDNTKPENKELEQLQSKITKLEEQEEKDKKAIDKQSGIIKELKEKLRKQENKQNQIEQENKELKNQLENERNKQDQDFDPSIKHTFIEWQKSGSSYFTSLSISDKGMELFSRFISPFEKYSLEQLQRFTESIKRIEELDKEIEKFKRGEKQAEEKQENGEERKETEINEENDLQKIKEKIKFLKEERQKYLPDAEGFTTKEKIDKEKELTKKINRLERKEKEIKQAQKIVEIRKTPRNIGDWVKVFQIDDRQLEKLQKLAELGIITVDFDNTLYTWKEVEEMLNKSLPVKKNTVFNWWISNKIGEEDYFLLKNAGTDVNKETLTEKELWELIDKTEQTFSKPVDKKTFQSWHEAGMINQEHYEILLNIKANPNQEFTLQEISELIKKAPKIKTIDEWFKEKRIVPEDYELLKKANIDTEKAKFSLAQVSSLIIEHDKKE